MVWCCPDWPVRIPPACLLVGVVSLVGELAEELVGSLEPLFPIQLPKMVGSRQGLLVIDSSHRCMVALLKQYNLDHLQWWLAVCKDHKQDLEKGDRVGVAEEKCMEQGERRLFDDNDHMVCQSDSLACRGLPCDTSFAGVCGVVCRRRIGWPIC